MRSADLRWFTHQNGHHENFQSDMHWKFFTGNLIPSVAGYLAWDVPGPSSRTHLDGAGWEQRQEGAAMVAWDPVDPRYDVPLPPEGITPILIKTIVCVGRRGLSPLCCFIPITWNSPRKPSFAPLRNLSISFLNEKIIASRGLFRLVKQYRGQGLSLTLKFLVENFQNILAKKAHVGNTWTLSFVSWPKKCLSHIPTPIFCELLYLQKEMLTLVRIFSIRKWEVASKWDIKISHYLIWPEEEKLEHLVSPWALSAPWSCQQLQFIRSHMTGKVS